MNTDETYMQRCLDLAKKGIGLVAPNPMVGAVLVYEGRILSEGYHAVFGGPHAEVDCLQRVREEDRPLIPHSTLYVSLEPCDHFGKTPPCTELISNSGIPRVVIGAKDISDKVNGKGVQKLKDRGVEVIEGCLESAATEMNRRFFAFHLMKRPYVILKWAQSADGFIGRVGETVKISNQHTDEMVHQWRSEEAAILVGTKTALTDDPALTVRLCSGKNPLRILLDMQLRVPVPSKIFNGEAPTWVFNVKESSVTEMYTRILLSQKEDVLQQVMCQLHQRNVLSVIIEGGAQTIQSFIDAGIWDEARIITNLNLFLGNGIAAPEIPSIPIFHEERLQNDSIRFFRNTHSKKIPH